MWKIVRKWFRKQFYRYPEIVIKKLDDSVIPEEIKLVGRLYPLLDTYNYNYSVGQIAWFIFTNTERPNDTKVGQARIINEKKYVSTWIHLGEDYFKCIAKHSNNPNA